MKVNEFWMPYCIFASLCYIGICSFVIDYMAKNLTLPFVELTKRIRKNVKKMYKHKQKNNYGQGIDTKASA